MVVEAEGSRKLRGQRDRLLEAITSCARNTSEKVVQAVVVHMVLWAHRASHGAHVRSDWLHSRSLLETLWTASGA